MTENGDRPALVLDTGHGGIELSQQHVRCCFELRRRSLRSLEEREQTFDVIGIWAAPADEFKRWARIGDTGGGDEPAPGRSGESSPRLGGSAVAPVLRVVGHRHPSCAMQ